MRFLVIAPDQLASGRVSFDVEQDRYLTRVLRRKAGDALEVVVAGEGRALTGRLEAGRRGLALAVASERALPPPPTPELTLAMGLIKGPRLEAVVRMATELGVNQLALLACEHAVVDWSKGGREDRLADIAVSASQQSGNPYPARIARFASVPAYLASAPVTRVIAVAHGGASPAQLVIPGDQPLALLVGPEGDFSASEIEAAVSAGAQTLTLSCPVLRAETAALVLCALMLDRLNRFASTSR